MPERDTRPPQLVLPVIAPGGRPDSVAFNNAFQLWARDLNAWMNDTLVPTTATVEQVEVTNLSDREPRFVKKEPAANACPSERFGARCEKPKGHEADDPLHSDGVEVWQLSQTFWKCVRCTTRFNLDFADEAGQPVCASCVKDGDRRVTSWLDQLAAASKSVAEAKFGRPVGGTKAAEQSPRPEWLPDDAAAQMAVVIEESLNKSCAVLDLVARWYNESAYAGRPWLQINEKIAAELGQENKRLEAERDKAQAGGRYWRDLRDRELGEARRVLPKCRQSQHVPSAIAAVVRERDEARAERDNAVQERNALLEAAELWHKSDSIRRAEAAEAKVARVEALLRDGHVANPSVGPEGVLWSSSHIRKALDGES